MKVFVYLTVIVIYIAAFSYLLLGALGFSFGLRVGGNTFVEEGVGLQRITCLVLLTVLVCVGFYSVWRISRRSV
jgi:hypothetical protein